MREGGRGKGSVCERERKRERERINQLTECDDTVPLSLDTRDALVGQTLNHKCLKTVHHPGRSCDGDC